MEIFKIIMKNKLNSLVFGNMEQNFLLILYT